MPSAPTGASGSQELEFRDVAQARSCSLEKRSSCQADEASKPPPAPHRARGSTNSAWQKRWKLGAVLLVLISAHMLCMNVVYPHFASTPLVTRVRGTITIRSVTTSSTTELGGSRVLRERSMARADATLETATAVALDALKAVAGAGSAAVQAAGLGAAAVAASSVAQQQQAMKEPAGQAAQQAQEVASAAAAAGSGGEEAQQPWPRPKSDAPRRRVPSLLPAWQCSEEGANFTAATQDSRYWLSSSQYVALYNASVPKYQWCRGAPPSLVPQLEQVLLMRSAKRRAPRGVTLVTQLSVERFAMLENQCRSWPHAISAALYVPTLGGRVFSAEDRGWNKAPLDAAIEAALKFHARAEACPTCCALDLEVVAEERCERQAAMLYPANAVRNRALLRAETDAVLLLDVDFCPSRELAALVDSPQGYTSLAGMLEARQAVVLPAFEPRDQAVATGKALALRAVAGDKAFVAGEYEAGRVIGFHTLHYPQGHGPTDFGRWLRAEQPYEIGWAVGFEPYILLARKYAPFYDERFRGYYWNKVQHLMHVHLQNEFAFVVHPRAFVVHVPHPQPSTKWLTRRSGQKDRNHHMFLEALELMQERRFVPVTSFPELCVPASVRATLESDRRLAPGGAAGNAAAAALMAQPKLAPGGGGRGAGTEAAAGRRHHHHQQPPSAALEPQQQAAPGVEPRPAMQQQQQATAAGDAATATRAAGVQLEQPRGAAAEQAQPAEA